MEQPITETFHWWKTITESLHWRNCTIIETLKIILMDNHSPKHYIDEKSIIKTFHWWNNHNSITATIKTTTTNKNKKKPQKTRQSMTTKTKIWRHSHDNSKMLMDTPSHTSDSVCNTYTSIRSNRRYFKWKYQLCSVQLNCVSL